MRILVAGGGTGGHLLPGVAVAKELRARGHHAHFAVRTDGSSQAFLAREGFPSSSFHFAGFPRTLSPRLAAYPFLAAAAFLSARRILRRETPDVVLGMGGYVSVPVGAAAVMGNVPLVVHEQNVRAGMANRLLSRWATAAGASFEPTERLSPRCPMVWTGLPLRPDLVPLDPAEARRSLGLSERDMTVLVFGGSQGARALNGALMRLLPGLEHLRNRWQFIHLTGEAEFSSVQATYRTLGWRAFVRAYWPDMAALYSAADFVVARAGANTVMELARMGKRSLLVPYPHAADDHQAANALWLEKRGAASVLPEKDLTESALRSVFDDLSDLDALRAENAGRLTRVSPQWLEAACRLADLVEDVGFRRAHRSAAAQNAGERGNGHA